MTPDSLKEISNYLEKRTQTDWRRMAKFWKLDAADASARQRLAEILSNPKILMPKVADLSPVAAWILNYHFRLPSTELSKPVVAAMAHGWEHHKVMIGIKELVYNGFLLAKEGITLERFIESGAEEGRIPSGVQAIQLAPIQEDFQQAHPPTGNTFFGAEGERLGTALADLVQLSQHKQLKLNQNRWLAGGQFSAVAKACPTSPVQPIELVEIAIRGGLLKMDQSLKVGPHIHLLNGPVVILLREVWKRVLCLKNGDAPDGHQNHNGLIPPSQPIYHLRWIVSSFLGRLKTDCWVSLSQILFRLLHIHPDIGIDKRVSHYTNPHAEPLKYLLSFILYTCRYFGLVDISGPADFLTDWASNNLLGWSTVQSIPEESLLRVTHLGKAILSGEDLRPEPLSKGQVILTPDFEVIVPTKGFSEFIHTLSRAAMPLPFSANDPVRRFRLERERWGNALQSGLSKEDFCNKLEIATGRPLPNNVVKTLEGWGENFGKIQIFTEHHLHRFATPAARDKFISTNSSARAVGTQDALAPTAPIPPGAFLIDYSVAPVRCLTFYEDGRTQLHKGRADLLVESEMALLFERKQSDWYLTQKSITLSDMDIDDIKNWMFRRTLNPIPQALLTRLMAWSGQIASPHLLQADILQLSTPENMTMLYHFPGISDHILGLISPTTSVLKPGRRAQVEEILKTLNLKYDNNLNLNYYLSR